MKGIYCISTIVIFIAWMFWITERDTSSSTVSESTIINVDYKRLFDFVLHPDTVEMWFSWISHFRSADKKPLGVGKLYQAVYSASVFGDHVLLFRVVKYIPDHYLVLESDSLFKPRFEVAVIPVSSGQKTRLFFRLTFQRKSLLFQYTVGPLLQLLARHYIENSLSFLHDMT